MVLETHMYLCMTESDFQGKFFLPQKSGKWAQNWPKTGFFEFIGNWVINFFWIWSIKKFYNIFCIPAQISYLRKFWFMRYGPKCSWPIDCSIFKLAISLEQNDEKAWFFTYWCSFVEIKRWLKNVGVGTVKNVCGHSDFRTLKLAVSQQGITRVSWFLVCW